MAPSELDLLRGTLDLLLSSSGRRALTAELAKWSSYGENVGLILAAKGG